MNAKVTDVLGERRRPKQRKYRSRPAPYRVEVMRRHDDPEPFGWVLFRRGGTEPIAESVTGCATVTDAWNAGGSKVLGLEHEVKRHTKAKNFSHA